MILCIISPKHHGDLRSYYMCIYIIYYIYIQIIHQWGSDTTFKLGRITGWLAASFRCQFSFVFWPGSAMGPPLGHLRSDPVSSGSPVRHVRCCPLWRTRLTFSWWRNFSIGTASVIMVIPIGALWPDGFLWGENEWKWWSTSGWHGWFPKYGKVVFWSLAMASLDFSLIQ